MASRSIARGIAVFASNSADLSRRVWVLVLVVVMVLSVGTVMAFSAESYADSRQSRDAVKVDDMIVPVQPVRVDPRTGEPIACADCPFPTKPYVSSADLDDGTSDAYRLIVGERLHSLWYEAGGVKVPLRSFTSRPDAAANGKRAGTVTLHPLLPDGNAAGEQDSVSLTIRAEGLEWDHNADTPTIFMGYAPQADWQRMYLTKGDLDADIQVNGVPLSGGRFMDAFLGGVTGQTGAQTVTETDSATGEQVEVEVPYRDVMISVPSGRSIAFTRYTADGSPDVFL